ncbi:VAMP727 protein [Hibiscus syriacus]|uniref:VAMP727 protein n=1 Tax=Hibiscus syriacus TaxID=106335 RepID=A0A6A2YRG7_HIBSY|nr:VAMP727 protein [Hibiscus syriacus]
MKQLITTFTGRLEHGIIIEFVADYNTRQSATYLPEVPAHEGFSGPIIESLRKRIKLTHYQGTLFTMHFSDYVSYVKATRGAAPSIAVFLVVADEAVGRSMPFFFLDWVLDDFKQRYGASIRNEGPRPLADDEDDDDLFEDQFTVAYNLDREFGPRLKEHMQYCMNHPEEIKIKYFVAISFFPVAGAYFCGYH